jgi:hypothetical protein
MNQTASPSNSSSRLSFVLSALALTSSCSHDVRTQVDFKSVEEPGTKHYDIRPEESYSMPTPVDHLPPQYPADALPLHLAHVLVRVKLIVDAGGNVTEARFNDASGDLSSFQNAVRDTVLKWHYTPFRIKQWEDVEDAEGNVVDSRLVSDESKPFSLDYEFTFDLRDGKPTVDSSRAQAP